ncbi:O-antigen ligase family protein [Dyadobacter tibetensis]|uniref:O-antigen ligase family protein n=1 Tax=Dyadobacter tibetensis TaxID=1211851 RepID=UPI00047033C3|nr:O-antigen ligase family protein [Dyadobacter tibetensis]
MTTIKGDTREYTGSLWRRKLFKISTISATPIWFLLILLSTIDTTELSIINQLFYTEYDYGPASVLVILIITFWVFSKKFSLKIPISRIDIIVVLYLAFSIVLLNFLSNSSGNTSFYLTEVLLTFISLRLMIINNITHWSYLILSLFAVGSIQAVYGILQSISILPISNRYNLPSGTLHNPAQLAIFLATIAGLAYNLTIRRSLAHQQKNNPLRAISMVTFLLTFMAMVTTQSRTAILSLVFYIVIATAYRFKKIFCERLLIIWRRIILSLMIIACVLSLWLAYSLKKDSADGRMLIWKVTMSMIPEIPLRGYGTNSFGSHYMKYQGKYFRTMESTTSEAFLADDIIYAYNEYLQIIIENGFIGLLLIIALILLARLNVFTSTGALVIIPMACAMTSYPFRIPCVFLCFIFGIALTSRSQTSTVSISFDKSVGLSAIAVVVSAIFLFFLHDKAFLERKAHYAYKFYSAGFYETAARKYYELDSIQRITTPQTLAYFGKSLAMTKRKEEALKVYERASKLNTNYYLVINHGLCLESLKRYQEAEKKYRLATEMLPGRLYPKYLLFQLYKKSNRFKLARNEARTILHVKDKKVTSASIEIREDVIEFLNNTQL